MNLLKIGIPVCILAGILLSCQSKITKDKLTRHIASRLHEQPGIYAVAFKDLASGEEIRINERENFHAASTMKTPVLIELCRQVVAGKFSLTDSIIVHNEFKSIVDSSVLHWIRKKIANRNYIITSERSGLYLPWRTI
jgi:beta-lactamase class A